MRCSAWVPFVLALGCGDDDEQLLDASPDASDASDASFDATIDAALEACALPSIPDNLSETPFYSDFASRTVNDCYVEYTPAWELWSDGAEKRRWIWLPAGTTIDTSNQDDWIFPVGAQLWKEFRSPEGDLLEIRLITRTDRQVSFRSYVWNDTETEATQAMNGATDVRGTEHDVPSKIECQDCHVGEPGRVLGFSALQLANSTGLFALSDAVSAGMLSDPPTADLTVPWDPTSTAAFGVLHANCGHCHVPDSGAARFEFPEGAEMWLTLGVDELDGTAAETRIYTGTVGRPLASTKYMNPELGGRVVPGSPSTSALPFRMLARGPNNQTSDAQMPPLGSETPDELGVAAISAWITSLTP